jgi:group I intron endonuclease
MSEYTNERIYTVYMHIFPDDKVYIGMTRQKIARRWRSNGSGYIGQPQVWEAINHFGWENVQHEIIATCLTRYEAEHMERNLVELYNANDIEYGYNIDYGGQGAGRVSQRTKDKLSELNTGWVPTDEQRLHMSIAQTGRQHPEEVKRKISESNKGKKMSDEAKRKISEARKQQDYYLKNLDKMAEISRKPILRYSVETGEFIARYESGREAAKEFGFDSAIISAAARGKKNQICGSIWLFESEAAPELIAECLDKARKNAKIYHRVAKKDENGEVICVYNSIADVVKATNTPRGTIVGRIKNGNPSPSGHYFTLISKEDFIHYSSLGLLYTSTKEPKSC